MKAKTAALIAGLGLVVHVRPALALQAVAAVVYPGVAQEDPAKTDDERESAWADSTAALFEAENVSFDRVSGRAGLASVPASLRFGLCPEEPFAAQPSGSYCSGALVGPDLVLTAAHCLRDVPCARTRVVFGFTQDTAAARLAPMTVPSADVYSCAAVVKQEYAHSTDDWALIRLDRPIAGRAPLPVDRGPLENETPLVMIGHPSGLPTKITAGARVYDASPATYFVSNMTNYAGSSGSPIFDARSGAIVGILVWEAMDIDYVPRDASPSACKVSTRCPNDSCAGARSTKASAFAGWIP